MEGIPTVRQRNRSLITSLLGLGATLAVATACALPTPPEPPNFDPGPGIATQVQAEPWQPSEEWLELYQRDAEVRDLLAQSLNAEDRDDQLALYDQYRERKNELQNYLIENPDADAPCATLARFAPPELWCTLEDAQLEVNLT
jgi:hypothetical protein